MRGIVMPCFRALVMVACLVILAACGGKQEPLESHLARGDQYYEEERYREAIIEYQTVLQAQRDNPRAMDGLGLAHYALGESQKALPFLLATRSRRPDDVETRLKIANLYLKDWKKAEAAAEVDCVLGIEPHNLEALMLLASLAISPERIPDALARMEAALPIYDRLPSFHLAMSRLALSAGDVAKAESALQAALAAEPRSVEALVAMGQFWVAQKNRQKAADYFEQAARLGGPGSNARVRLAEFHFMEGRREEARKLLEDVTAHSTDSLEAHRLLAGLLLDEGKVDPAAAAATAALAVEPNDGGALLVMGKVDLARGRVTEAIQNLQKLIVHEPRFVPAHFALAEAYLKAGRLDEARVELEETIRLSPGFDSARFLLADVNLKLNNVAGVKAEMEPFTSLAADRVPVRALLILCQAYLKGDEKAQAVTTCKQYADASPGELNGAHLYGLSLLRAGRSGEALQEFERALSIAPEAYEPLAQIVRLAASSKNWDAAVARLNEQIARLPAGKAHHFLLLGDVYARKGDLASAETQYTRALEADPGFGEALARLGRLHARRGDFDGSLRNVDKLIAEKPKYAGPVLLRAQILQLKGDTAAALAAYQKALEMEPRAALAANNAAGLLAEDPARLGDAMKMAERARELSPQNPHVLDTYGWLQYKTGAYRAALGPLSESASKLQDNAIVQYHLGMVQYRLGSREPARLALSRALELDPDFEGAAEARQVVGTLE